MLRAFERVLESRIQMYEMFIGHRNQLNMDASADKIRKQECYDILQIVKDAQK